MNKDNLKYNRGITGKTLRRMFLPGVVMALLGSACASIGTPSGGARDEDPPRFVRANPAPGSTNVTPQRVNIEFDELVNVKDAFMKVVVSPPSKSTPRVSSLGKRVTVQFNDTLLPNTTYTIDFGNAIEDNNEGNKLQGFTYSFSTGDVIDTLQISGMVLSAESLEPQQGMLVGVYSNLSDTAFSTLPFERIAKTDDRGRFSIKGLAPGEYRIFALGDNDNDYYRANPEEATAFLDYTLTPSAVRKNTVDSIFNLKTGELDTVRERERTLFLPNDVLLRSFESGYKPQFLQKYERLDSTRLSFIFNAPSDSLPYLEVVDHPEFKDWWVLEKSEKNDTLTYWMVPEALVAIDSLRISARYLRTDSVRSLAAVTDTLRFFMPRFKPQKEDKKKNSETDTLPPKPDPLEFNITSPTTQEVWKPVYMEFSTPLASLDTSAFHLETMIDSVWENVPLPWRPEPVDSLNPRLFKIEYPWDYATDYRLTIDTLATEGIYGLFTDPAQHKFKTKAEEDYCSLTFVISDFNDTVPAFAELLNTSDVPLRRVAVENGKAYFPYLPPGKYYARIYEDFNGNGRFDTGEVETGVQPDMVYYYPKMINIKKNWERTEEWQVFATAIDLMKPENLKKNKPEADKRARAKKQNNQNEEDEEEYFDPTRNPFDPNDRGRYNNASYYR